MVSALLSRVVILVFGLLYPAYASYKAVKTKNVKDYVKWMMYWIVFALFCAVETFTDVFLSWLPFYYEVKIIFVLWLLSPVTKGASLLYRKFVHPQLNKREKEIDDAIAQARTKGYSTLMTLGHKGLTYATKAVVTTAMKGQTTLVEHYKKSYSTNDLRINQEGERDEMDGNIGYIDESDEEFDKTKTEQTSAKPEPETDNRLMADNRELNRREKDKNNRRSLHRSKSDASETRTRKTKQSVSDLAPLDEDEHETSHLQEQRDKDVEVIDTDPRDTVKTYRYYPPRVRASLSAKEVKSDPYATLPRTRSRQRPRLHQY